MTFKWSNTYANFGQGGRSLIKFLKVVVGTTEKQSNEFEAISSWQGTLRLLNLHFESNFASDFEENMWR